MAKWGPSSKKRNNFRIIDDDALFSAHHSDDEDREEAPTVAFVVDDRPDSVKFSEEYEDKSKWRKILANSDQDSAQPSTSERRDSGDNDQSSFKKVKRKESEPDSVKAKHRRKDNDHDQTNSDELQRQSSASTKPKGGLTDAKEVRRELAERRKREDELFKREAAAFGANAETIVRDRKTGKRIDRSRVEAEQREEEEREQATAAQYARWSGGLKQTEILEAAAEEYAIESSKPFARYAEDNDREALLKSVIRSDDPMREFLTSKAQQVGADGESTKEKPRYRGPFPPNRFGIEPGYRWDGVDRSTGFEKRYFDSLANRTAIREENYRWATADL